MNILVIDDNRIFLKSFCDSLKNKCLEVDKTDNPVEALKLLKQKKYDIVVCDMFMPLFKGADILKMVKKVDSSIRVIIYDDNISKADYDECISLGALEVIDKKELKENLENKLLTYD